MAEEGNLPRTPVLDDGMTLCLRPRAWRRLLGPRRLRARARKSLAFDRSGLHRPTLKRQKGSALRVAPRFEAQRSLRIRRLLFAVFRPPVRAMCATIIAIGSPTKTMCVAIGVCVRRPGLVRDALMQLSCAGARTGAAASVGSGCAQRRLRSCTWPGPLVPVMLKLGDGGLGKHVHVRSTTPREGAARR
jgi:hypothetical protein